MLRRMGISKSKEKDLILGGGNAIGSPPATRQSVFATLICEGAAPFIAHSTTLTGVLLAPTTATSKSTTCSSPCRMALREPGAADSHRGQRQLVCRRHTHPWQIRLRFV